MITQIIIDDFHPVAMPIAKIARGLEYGPKEWKGQTYKGIGTGYVPEMFYDLITRIIGSVPEKRMDYFRLGTKEDSATTYIHVDSGVDSKFAAVWYLSEAPENVVAGTAFWKHRETGLEFLPDSERGNEQLLSRLDFDGADESKWQMTGLCGQRFNRCVIYPTNIFHSRYPQDAWGNDATDGRIVFTSFFDA